MTEVRVRILQILISLLLLFAPAREAAAQWSTDSTGQLVQDPAGVTTDASGNTVDLWGSDFKTAIMRTCPILAFFVKATASILLLSGFFSGYKAAKSGGGDGGAGIRKAFILILAGAAILVLPTVLNMLDLGAYANTGLWGCIWQG